MPSGCSGMFPHAKGRRLANRVLKGALLLSLVLAAVPAQANGDSAEAFMSATFGLSESRTQKRMERSGATASGFAQKGILTMKGTFEYRSALFTFGFHPKKGLNHKAVYIASTGDPDADRALYEALRQAYNIRFGTAQERATSNIRAKGRIVLGSTWLPNKYTTIALSCNPEMTERFPGDSPGKRPIHLIYTYSKWTR